MAPLVAPDICRLTVNQTYFSREVVNILDVRLELAGSGLNRQEACDMAAGDLLNNWDDHIRPSQVDNLSCSSVSWVDLDSATGSTGTKTSTPETTWPAVGGNTVNTPFPGNVALLVSKVTSGGGRSTRNGRMYVGGIVESLTDASNGNLITTGDVTSWNGFFASLLSGMNDAGGVGQAAQTLVVVHTEDIGTPTNPNVVFTSATDIDSFSVQQRLATQRRRLRG